MRLKTIPFLFLVASTASFAETFNSTIHSVDIGHVREPHLVRFDNGRVSFVDSKKSLLVSLIRNSERKGDVVEVVVDKNNNIVSVEGDSNEVIEELETIEHDNYHVPYTPAVVKNNNAALKIFRQMRRDYRKAGECFNRAHIWAYEEFKRSGLNSMKVFMFFTERYIRKYKFHWWFHVTPMVYVGNKTSPRTLDRRYTSGPRQTKIWSDTFVKSKRTCKKVEKFDDFWLNQKTQDCYHIHSSMYYLKPRDLEKRDLTGIEKDEFIGSEINRAYKNAFIKSTRRTN